MEEGGWRLLTSYHVRSCLLPARAAKQVLVLVWGRLWQPQSHPAVPPRGGARTAHTFLGLQLQPQCKGLEPSLPWALDFAGTWWATDPGAAQLGMTPVLSIFCV